MAVKPIEMKQEESKILNSLGKDTGFKVPEGYFEDFNKRMAESLPEVQITPVDNSPSLWIRIRPFVYMAAMFAGVWLMLNVMRLGANGDASNNRQAAEVSNAGNDLSGSGIIIEQNGSKPSFDVMTYEDSVAAGLSRE